MNVLVLGGDERSRFLHILLKQAGYYVDYYDDIEIGLGEIKTGDFDMVILPIPTKLGQGGSLKPFKQIDLEEILRVLPKEAHIIYGSGNDTVKNLLIDRHSTNLLDDEEFAIKNAYLTAEAALCIAMQNGESMIKDKRCLICGFGRIGAALFKLLMAVDAKVDVASGNTGSVKIIRSLGSEAVRYDEIAKRLDSYDMIFNTAPAPNFKKSELKSFSGIYYELASPPYGFEAGSQEDKDCNIIMCPALPGRCYPKDAASVIYQCIFSENQ